MYANIATISKCGTYREEPSQPSSVAMQNPQYRAPAQPYTHPLKMCLERTVYRDARDGSNSILYGPESAPCQAYMAERCAANWDGVCDYFYTNNTEVTPNTFMGRPWVPEELRKRATTGEHLLNNAGELKFCTYTNCKAKKELFNPLDPNSPYITTYHPTDNDIACWIIPRHVPAP